MGMGEASFGVYIFTNPNPKQSISHVVITEANVDVDSTTIEATTASQSPPQCESTTLQTNANKKACPQTYWQ